MRAIQITEFGGPEVLTLTELPDPRPRGDLQVVRVSAAGVNFADTHQTENTYLAKQTLPLVPGAEFAGTTEDGRRVVGLLAGGGYAEQVIADPTLMWDLPDAVSDGQALALVLQGVTAWHLLRTSTHLATGESVVVHAGAGGVGSLAIQLARTWGAGRVIATASNPDKRELALSLGADAALDPADPDLGTALIEANGGARVDVVLEMTGGAVFDASLTALAPFGRLATYGMASRRIPRPVPPAELMGRSQAVIGFWLAHCFARPAMLDTAMTDLLDRVQDGSLNPVLGGSYPLAEARRAHEDLLARRSVGKLTLDPSR